ncbi:MAG: hypothetical protein M0R03_19900 [Novosphingobium sp.]|nr:hypothetical protein [Novosphingobium sp.]
MAKIEKSKYLKVGKEAQVQVEYECLPWDYSKQNCQDMIEILSQRYDIPKKQIKIIPDFIQIGKDGKKSKFTNDTTKNIQDPKVQIKLFEDYIEQNNIEDVDFNEIVKIDNEINSKINYDNYDKFRRYSIEWLEFDNFLSYGKGNKVDFTKLNGLVLVNSEPSNQGGKTTLCIDLISFLLYGSVGDKAGNLNELFNRFLKEETKLTVKGCIKIDERKFLIERTITRPKKRTENSKASQEVKYYELINGEYDADMPLEEYNPKDAKNEGEQGRTTNKLIKETIGKQSDYELIISATAKTLTDLINNVGDTDRGRLLNRWLGLQPIEEKEKLAKERYKSLSQSFLSNRYNTETLLKEIEDLKESIENSNKISEDLNTKLIDVTSNIEQYEKTKEVLFNTKGSVDQTLMKLDISTVNNKLNNIKTKGKDLRQIEEDLKKQFNELKDITFDNNVFDELLLKQSDFNTILIESRTKLTSLKANNSNLENSKACPTCKREYDKSTVSKIEEQIKINKDEIERLIEIGVKTKTEKENLEKEIEKQKEIKLSIEKRNRIELSISKNKIELANLLNEYTTINQKLTEYNKNKETIDKNNELDIEINNINVRLTNNKSQKDSLIRQMEFEKNNKKNYVNTIKEKETIITELSKESVIIRYWKLYLDIVGKNGISKNVLRTTLPIINNELDRFLNDVVDFQVEVVVTDKNECQFNIIQDGVIGKLKSSSGYELTVAALALREVLANLSTIPKMDFAVFDEILAGCSKDNYNNVKNVIDKIVKNYQFVFFITHEEEAKDWANQTITVVKKNRISELKQEI